MIKIGADIEGHCSDLILRENCRILKEELRKSQNVSVSVADLFVKIRTQNSDHSSMPLYRAGKILCYNTAHTNSETWKEEE
jgi:hypothetical protein